MSDRLHLVRRDGVATAEVRVPALLAPGALTLMDELDALLDEVSAARDVHALVLSITSATHDEADAAELAGVDPADARARSQRAQRINARVASSSKPVVAALPARACGAAFELALACRSRVAAVGEGPRFGLDQVRRGLAPASGGTQRLPRLVGVQVALEWMLRGLRVSATDALEAGAIDQRCPPGALLDEAVDQAHALGRQHGTSPGRFRAPRGLTQFAIAGNPVGRRILFDQARRQLDEVTGGHYPAPARVLDVVRKGLERGEGAGLRAESSAFVALAASPEARALARLRAEMRDAPEPLGARKLGVVGGGAGAVVAALSAARADVRVRLCPEDAASAAEVVPRVLGALGPLGAHVTASPLPGTHEVAGLLPDTGLGAGLARCDVLMLTGEITTRAALGDAAAALRAWPGERLLVCASANGQRLGARAMPTIRYFDWPASGVPAGPEAAGRIAEIVADREHAGDAARAAAFASRQGFVPLALEPGARSFVLRVLRPALDEAARLVCARHAIDSVDAAARAVGMSLPPLALLDAIGGPAALDWLDGRSLADIEGGDELAHLGAAPFHRSPSEDEHGPQPNEEVYRLVRAYAPGDAPRDAGERMLLLMVNAALRALDDGVVTDVARADVAAVLGGGFPAYTGGPFSYVDRHGAADVARRMRGFAKRHGARFDPAARLVGMAEAGQTFYAESASST